MILRVQHITSYKYSLPVFLEPHIIRLNPRPDPAQKQLFSSLRIYPEPVCHVQVLDCCGNLITHVWFDKLTQDSQIVSEFEVETLRVNPFDFLWLEGSDKLGFEYSEKKCLEPYLQNKDSPGPQLDITQYILKKSKGATLYFLTALTQEIFELIESVIREDGATYTPEETLRLGKGACRDVAMLFCSCCREVGLAARFVSGYQAGDPDTKERHLHAWAEVYLPGAGWRGFDPTLGLAVADEHVTIAAAVDPEGAAAISGSFRKTGATAQMSTVLEIQHG